MTRLLMTLAGPDHKAIFAACVERGLVPSGKPERVVSDFDARSPSADWAARWLPEARRQLYALYPNFPDQVVITPGSMVDIGLASFDVSSEKLLELLSGVPFEVASFGSIHDWDDLDYSAPSFSDGHVPLGWGCAFKGRGHDRLVSRRWLDHGPWRTLRGPNDTTLVQFHDLDADADPAAALAQARPAHRKMGISDEGGFLQHHFVYTQDLSGFYDDANRRLKIVVHGRPVSDRELLERCAARRDQKLGPEKPIDRIAYVFIEESEAQRHLHALWLRELECWTIRDGVEVRLDDSYSPPA